MLITSLLELHIRTTQSAVPSVFIMQSEQLYKRKFLKKPFDSFLLRHNIRRCSLGTAFFFALNLFRGGRSQDIHQELTLLNLFLFFVSLSFSLIIRMSYNFMFSLLGFVTTNMFGLWQVNKAIVQLTSGAVIPLVFFPEAVRKVFAVLPFASLISTPLNIFLGKFSAEEILRAFALQVLWIVIITIAGNIIWKKVVKHLVIQGG